MENKIHQLIKTYDTIVISRHKSPDLDAYGAQFGLYYALKNQYPNKRIYAIGDTNSLNHFGELDSINDDILSQSLYFILDTSVRQMLADDKYLQAAKVVIIDHHQNDSDIEAEIFYRDTEISSCSEMIAAFLINAKIEITKEAAKPLYMGIVGDTGRFLFANVRPETFRIAATLLETGIELAPIYNLMYVESLKMKRVKAEYLNSFQLTRNNVGYRKNDHDFLTRHQLDSNTVSRGLANQLSGIREIPIWANFTYDTASGRILCELRSRETPIVNVAKKYGGGGHLLACGCTVDSFKECDLILEDLDKLLEA